MSAPVRTTLTALRTHTPKSLRAAAMASEQGPRPVIRVGALFHAGRSGVGTRMPGPAAGPLGARGLPFAAYRRQSRPACLLAAPVVGRVPLSKSHQSGAI